ncbi:cobyric acid synthase [Paenibacillus alkaliterrae]|uniref:cobyric acid synthase n=1 Tax=Paenibacillus alkaliterrae TaxID=320909 RepID=UPI001F3D3A68|nr:cobyric acid synthase [Paenibacillus alkaliterrae]MCF2937118.1 cobyric acid synthase [Paenibacillus alkaliterrae]
MSENHTSGSRPILGRTIMLQGTASDVGKSLMTAALCRIFTQDGFAAAPFKSQNMSLNSYVTWDGKEIGRAQGMQADACGILATTDMNPILLKPSGEMSSQVVVHGKPLRDYDAREYRESYLPIAGEIVRESLQRLRESYDIIVLEGAGSPAEINLKDRDIVNMRMAAWADAPVILVADIDRGGVFASIVGTLELLEQEERDRVCGFVINKFRGDVSLLQSGLDWLEQKTGKPVLGVIPFIPNLELEDEDSLSLSKPLDAELPMSGAGREAELDIAVIRLPRISNFTDIDPLRFEEDVRLRYIERVEQWGRPDAVILPGSKNTIEDLLWLKNNGLAERLQKHMAAGGWTAGLCGGYEMLGERLLDPLHVESAVEETKGLGLFPFVVNFTGEKRTVRVEGSALLSSEQLPIPITGYEIHMGEVNSVQAARPIHRPFQIREQRDLTGSESLLPYEAEGAATPDGRQWGTFIHGILHNDDFRRAWLNDIREAKGLKPLRAELRFQERRELAFERLAEHARRYLNMPYIYQLLGMAKEGGR